MRWNLLWSRTTESGNKSVGNKGTDYTTLRFKISLTAKRKNLTLKKYTEVFLISGAIKSFAHWENYRGTNKVLAST